MRLAALLLALLPARLAACETALVLAMDVSGSVDAAEYRMQAEGIADALLDPVVRDIVLRDRVAIAVLQWSGADRQRVTTPWTRPADADALRELSDAVRDTPRAFLRSDTAPGEAIRAALGLFDAVPDCRRRVIDLSGDGTPNAGSPTWAARNAAQAAGVTINGLAIESLGLAITGFYRAEVITADGFVITARDHREFPRAMRAKLIRELSRPLG